ncbi:MAG: DUF4233 domain-containing protein [Actinomycetota bacterium]
MKVLASAVLTMEALVMGFAILLASKSEDGLSLTIGGVLAILLILSVGTLRSKFGWVVASILQIAMIGYGFIVTPLFFLGALFAGLWVCAIVVGRKGEEARARLLASGDPRNNSSNKG